MEIPVPQFEIGSTVESTSDALIGRRRRRVGRVESQTWIERRGAPAEKAWGYWRYTIRWLGGGTSNGPAKYLQPAKAIACDLKVVVGGVPIKVETTSTATVLELIEQVLLKSGAATHEGTVQWELRTEDGRELKHLVGDAEPVDGETVLFLDPVVGGGARGIRLRAKADEGTRLQKVGHVGVDSGRVMLVDPCYAERVKSGDIVSHIGISDLRHVESAVNMGVVAQTGVGDGLFPVIAELVDGKLNGLLIDFGDEDLEKGILGARMIARGAEAPEIVGPVEPSLTADQRDQLRYVDGWKGTQPVEGTRRALIRDVLSGSSARLTNGTGGHLTNGSALHLADDVESALLESTIYEEARERRASIERLDTVAEENERRGSRELHVVLADNSADSPQMLFVEIEDEKGASVGGFEHRREGPLTHIVIPYGRDDAWVSEVAYQAAGAATRPLLEDHPDYVFPSERVADAVAELLKDFGIARACRDCAGEQLEHGAKEVDGRRDDTIKSLTLRCDSLLAQRESARGGEDHFKAQRDAALHLLRWLIGDLIPADLIRFQADEEGD